MNGARFLSVHFPKAGGSSLLVQFRTLLGEGFATDYTRVPLTGAPCGPAEFPAGKRLLHGHFNPLRYAAAGARWVTFLREPVENLISIWSYWHAIPPSAAPLHRRFLAERPSVEAFAAYPGLRELMSRVYFGGVDMGRFEFLGFHDRRAEDIPRLGALLGLPLSAEVHENESPPDPRRGEMLADSALRARLAGILREDMRFYEALRR